MDKWLIWNHERGMWWLKSRHGYTLSVDDAGVFSFEEALNTVSDANNPRPERDTPEETMVAYSAMGLP